MTGAVELFNRIIADLDPDGSIRAKTKPNAGGDRSPPAASPHAPPLADWELPPLAKRIDRARRYLAKIDPAVEGEGGSCPTFKAARVLVHGFCLDAHTALGLLLTEYNPHCVPPWPVKQLEHKVSEAETKPFAKERGWLLRPKDGGCKVRNNPDGLPADPAPHPDGRATSAPTLNEAEDDPHKLARAVLAGYGTQRRRTLVYWQGEFHEWDGCRYRTVPGHTFRPAVNAVVRRELEAVHTIRLEAFKADGEGDPPKLPKTTDALVGNVLAAMQGMCLVKGVADAPAWLPGVTGSDPRQVVASTNGLVDLPAYAAGESSGVRGNTPDLLNFTSVPFAVDPAAPAPTAWFAFLAELWPDDPESVALLQEWFGYLLTPDTRQQKMLLMVGPPRAGKGTIAAVLRALVGEDNVTGPTLAGLTTQFGLAGLLGKTVAVISDARLSGRADAVAVTERLLTISGEDAITVERKYLPSITVRLAARFVLATNELPHLSDASTALAARWSVLRLTRTFLGHEDKSLLSRLLLELPGIFNWAVAGWARLQRQGRFTTPTASHDLIDDVTSLTSPVAEFVREKCDVGTGRLAEVTELYESWERWCKACGRKEPGTLQSFCRQLRACVHTLRTERPRRNGNRIRCYSGISVKDAIGYGADDRTALDRADEEVVRESDLWSANGPRTVRDGDSPQVPQQQDDSQVGPRWSGYFPELIHKREEGGEEVSGETIEEVRGPRGPTRTASSSVGLREDEL